MWFWTWIVSMCANEQKKHAKYRQFHLQLDKNELGETYAADRIEEVADPADKTIKAAAISSQKASSIAVDSDSALHHKGLLIFRLQTCRGCITSVRFDATSLQNCLGT